MHNVTPIIFKTFYFTLSDEASEAFEYLNLKAEEAIFEADPTWCYDGIPIIYFDDSDYIDDKPYRWLVKGYILFMTHLKPNNTQLHRQYAL